MTDPFLAEIRVFGFNFAPQGWAFCDGQVLPINQNTALFSLLGTMYGGNGISNFALPNLQGRAAVDVGQGPGLSEYVQGEEGGLQTVTLFEAELPAHTHQPQGVNENATQQAPAPNRSLARSSPGFAYQSDSASNLVPLDPQAGSPAGGGFAHDNMPPATVLNFCIALQGIFPARP